jgi:hypothetical protein
MTRFLLLLTLVTVTAGEASAQRSLAIERFDAVIRVEADGTIDVTETITARFTGSWNGIYRSIPGQVPHRPRPQLDPGPGRAGCHGRRGPGAAAGVEPRGASRQAAHVDPGRQRRDPHGGAPLPGHQRAPVLRRARRTVLERDRRRVGRPDRGGHGQDRAAVRCHGSAGCRVQRRVRRDGAGRLGRGRGDRRADRHAPRAGVPRRADRRGRVGQGARGGAFGRRAHRRRAGRATGRCSSRCRCSSWRS